jgi:hypothetical protein
MALWLFSGNAESVIAKTISTELIAKFRVNPSSPNTREMIPVIPL